VSTIDSVAVQYNVPLVTQYDELLAVPNLCSHFTQGIFPDNTVLAMKAQRQAEVLQPIVESLMK
jgi:hypothetical protein